MVTYSVMEMREAREIPSEASLPTEIGGILADRNYTIGLEKLESDSDITKLSQRILDRIGLPLTMIKVEKSYNGSERWVVRAKHNNEQDVWLEIMPLKQSQ